MPDLAEVPNWGFSVQILRAEPNGREDIPSLGWCKPELLPKRKYWKMSLGAE
jgi:hypothetical protein